MTPSESLRFEESDKSIDAAEIEWWNRFAQIENDYCWVQTPQIQRLLRGDYLKSIIAAIPRNGSIVEIGCGTGWLCLLLAKLGANHVHGIDISSAQIDIARKEARNESLDDRVTFSIIDAADLAASSSQYDVVVAHAFLHHLSGAEIRRVIDTVATMLKPTGRFFVFEPIAVANTQSKWLSNTLLGCLITLQSIWVRGQRLGVRRISPKEKSIRALIANRHVGTSPRGPSPKEMPFLEGELNNLLSTKFRVEQIRRCMAVSHLVAQEILLFRITNPRLGRLLLFPVLRLARWIERLLLSQEEIPSGTWVFELIECSLREVNAPHFHNARDTS